MLYEMLTGQPPFTGPSPLAVMNERVVTDPAPVRELEPEISPEIEEILFRALARDPAAAMPLQPRWPGSWSTRSLWESRVARIGRSCWAICNQPRQIGALRGSGGCAVGIIRCDVAAGPAIADSVSRLTRAVASAARWRGETTGARGGADSRACWAAYPALFAPLASLGIASMRGQKIRVVQIRLRQRRPLHRLAETRLGFFVLPCLRVGVARSPMAR